MALLRSPRGKPDLPLAVDVPQVPERITTVAGAGVGVPGRAVVVVAVDRVRETNLGAESWKQRDKAVPLGTALSRCLGLRVNWPGYGIQMDV